MLDSHKAKCLTVLNLTSMVCTSSELTESASLMKSEDVYSSVQAVVQQYVKYDV